MPQVYTFLSFIKSEMFALKYNFHITGSTSIVRNYVNSYPSGMLRYILTFLYHSCFQLLVEGLRFLEYLSALLELLFTVYFYKF